MAKEMPLPYVPIDPLIKESNDMQNFISQLDLWDDPMPERYIIALIMHHGKNPTTDGYLGHISNKGLAKICHWEGDPDKFVVVLQDTGWTSSVCPQDVLQDNSDKKYWKINNWSKYGGLALGKRNAWRENKRKWRERKNQKEQEIESNNNNDLEICPTGRPEDVLKTSQGRPVGVLSSEGYRVKGKGCIVNGKGYNTKKDHLVHNEIGTTNSKIAPTSSLPISDEMDPPNFLNPKNELVPQKSKKDSWTAQADKIFEHRKKRIVELNQSGYLKLPIPKKLNDKDKRAIIARLKEGYTVEEVCLAVDGCLSTKHNLGYNENEKPYIGLELICRDGSNVDRFITNATAQKNVDGHTLKYLEASKRLEMAGPPETIYDI